MLFLCSPKTEFEVCLSLNQKHKISFDFNRETWGQRKFLTHREETVTVNTENQMSSVRWEDFHLVFLTLGYHSITHYIIQLFHYAFILPAIHSFNINIHESQNHLYVIVSMIFLINILKNVNYPLNISNTVWIEHWACKHTDATHLQCE